MEYAVDWPLEGAADRWARGECGGVGVRETSPLDESQLIVEPKAAEGNDGVVRSLLSHRRSDSLCLRRDRSSL